MNKSINKDTKIYGSFSERAGNKGCIYFNQAFESNSINAIYKSFSIKDISKAYEAAKVLGFSGFAVSMPFKKEIYNMVDVLHESAKLSKAVNTVVFREDGKSVGCNTDYYAAIEILKNLDSKWKNKNIYILGNGGLASAVKAAANYLGLKIKQKTRKNWHQIKNIKDSLVVNCTPVENIELNPSNLFLNFIIGTPYGDSFHKIQAQHQFLIYTGKIKVSQ